MLGGQGGGSRGVIHWAPAWRGHASSASNGTHGSPLLALRRARLTHNQTAAAAPPTFWASTASAMAYMAHDSRMRARCTPITGSGPEPRVGAGAGLGCGAAAAAACDAVAALAAAGCGAAASVAAAAGLAFGWGSAAGAAPSAALGGMLRAAKRAGEVC